MALLISGYLNRLIRMRNGIAYVSFDSVPAPKGAATHIQAFVLALARHFGSIELVTVGAGSAEMPPVERWPGVMHYELPAMGKSLVDRVLCFQLFLRRWLETRSFRAVHFRSTFEGMPLLRLQTCAGITVIVGVPGAAQQLAYSCSRSCERRRAFASSRWDPLIRGHRPTIS